MRIHITAETADGATVQRDFSFPPSAAGSAATLPAADAEPVLRQVGEGQGLSSGLGALFTTLRYLLEKAADLGALAEPYELQRLDRFGPDEEAGRAWLKTTEWLHLDEAQKACQEAIEGVDDAISACPCETIGDVMAKLRYCRDWLLCDGEETAVMYADVHFKILKSMLDVAKAQADRAPDRLADAIKAYRVGMDDFNRNAPEPGSEEYAARTFLPAEEVLQNWEAPATSLEETIAALKLASEALDDGFDATVAGPMLTAALAYLESREGGV